MYLKKRAQLLFLLGRVCPVAKPLLAKASFVGIKHLTPLWHLQPLWGRTLGYEIFNVTFPGQHRIEDPVLANNL